MNVLDGNRYRPPASNEAEISIFGPGIGECIVVHLGGNEWIVVDSCLDRKSRQPVALQYLHSLDVNVASSVKLFVVTHWHDDHINGAAKILEACQTAHFVCSLAMYSREFSELVFAYGERSQMESSGVDEFRSILDELDRRQTGEVRREAIGPRYAISDRPLLTLARNGRPFDVRVTALSPSDAAVTLAKRELALLFPQEEGTRRRAVARRPNDASVAIWISIGNRHFLLGADLETQPSDHVGWKAVVLSSNRPNARASVIKIPHHGSPNAYYREMWIEMAGVNPIALIAPFASGTRSLPQTSDVARIRRHTDAIYCTGQPSGWRPPRRDNTVERTIREVAVTRRAIRGPMGQVRVRFPVEEESGDTKIELFDGAMHLSDDQQT